MDFILLIISVLILLLCLAGFFKKSANVGVDPVWLEQKLNEKISGVENTLRDNFERLNERNIQFQADFQSKTREEIQNLNEKVNFSIFGLKEESKEASFSAFTKTQEQLEKMKQDNLKTLNEIQEFIQNRLNEGLRIMNETNGKNFEILNKTNQDKLGEIQARVEFKMDEQLKKNLESFAVVQENLLNMQNSASQMIESSKSIDKLNNIFARTSSKSFGNFGEQYLEQILADTLIPKTWIKQYNLPGTQANIDFCIRMGESKIGVDCKFPVTKYNDYLEASLEQKEHFKKALHASIKEMADSIYIKYVRPDHFAYTMMYVPSDNLYQEIVNSETLSKYFATRKITPTSPNTILPQLLLVNEYNRKIFINKNAEEIQKGLKKIAKNITTFQDEFRKLGDKLRTAQSNFDTASRSLDNIHGEVLRLETESEGDGGEGEVGGENNNIQNLKIGSQTTLI